MKASDVTAVLLAGGQSKRMGADKRMLEVGGQSIFLRALRVLETIFQEVIISVAGPVPGLPTGPHRIVVDEVLGCATLGGLYTGLKSISTDWAFVVACDMPLLNSYLIRYLVGQREGYDYVIPMLVAGPQPMHACYRKTCLPLLKRRIEAGELRIQGLLEEPRLRGRLVPEAELRGYDPQLVSFLNINTPADLEMVRKLVSQRS